MNLTPRIWWISQKKMLQAYAICYDTMAVEVEADHGRHLALLGNEYILSRPTGRQDINGKMIYEGDFVKLHHRDRSEGIEYTIKGTVIFGWSSSGFTIFDKGGNGMAHPVPAPDPVDDEDKDYMEDDEVEVLGNVFENPELIDPVVVNKKLIKC